MWISSFQIKNYKSFVDSPGLRFAPGINIIVGQNNVGKSALLEAVELRFKSNPHKSRLSVPRRGTTVNPTVVANVTFTITGEELRRILWNRGGPYHFPRPADNQFRNQAFIKLLERSFAMPEINFRFSISTQAAELAWRPVDYPSGNLYRVESEDSLYCVVQPTPEPYSFKYSGDGQSSRMGEFGMQVVEELKARTYRFNAERLNVGEHPYGRNLILAPNAANLAEVIHTLQGDNPERMGELNRLLREIFPSIYRVAARNKSAQQVEIVVWTEDPATQRDDLTNLLSESGTGIGQVVAILYVAIMAEFRTIILIDEPNSFLHPSGARKLIEILRRDFSRHQYIVSTHSPEIVRAAHPSTLTLIRWNPPQSEIEQLNTKTLGEVQKCLLEVGVKLSDVFAADQILWVEGQTEEECYGLILDKLGGRPVLGMSIVAVRNTGDFDSKRPTAALIWDIYSKLSASNALLPPAVAFVFDREGRTEKEIENLKRRSGGRVRFLPRRMYENYLLVPDALEAVMRSLDTFAEFQIEKTKIAVWLKDKGLDSDDPTQLILANGAKLLKELFDQLSEGREQYRKTLHSVRLTEWLIENEPEALAEIVEFLNEVLSEGGEVSGRNRQP
jgi:predicted ATPase